jgi:hypothetical protein
MDEVNNSVEFFCPKKIIAQKYAQDQCVLFVFLGEFFATWRSGPPPPPPPPPKKKGLANPTKGFLRFKKNNRHILTKNT